MGLAAPAEKLTPQVEEKERSMRKRTSFLQVVAAGAIIVALSATVFAADALPDAGGAMPTAVAASAENAGNAGGHATLPDVAASVIAALVGGENPSTFLSQRSNATKAHGKPAGDEDTTAQEVEGVSSGQGLGQTGTAGTKPGWGCGDKNHDHTGPPGRPNATKPPGCAKAH